MVTELTLLLVTLVLTLYGWRWRRTFALANVGSVKATADTITDFAAGENITIRQAGEFADLHDADGDAFSGATTGIVST